MKKLESMLPEAYSIRAASDCGEDGGWTASMLGAFRDAPVRWTMLHDSANSPGVGAGVRVGESVVQTPEEGQAEEVGWQWVEESS